jgi:hypothetical protein
MKRATYRKLKLTVIIFLEGRTCQVHLIFFCRFFVVFSERSRQKRKFSADFSVRILDKKIYKSNKNVLKITAMTHLGFFLKPTVHTEYSFNSLDLQKNPSSETVLLTGKNILVPRLVFPRDDVKT